MATTKAFELGDLGTELVVNADGTIASLDIDTDGVTEGSTNLYFTNVRARGAISVSGNLTYDSGTGVLGFTMPTTIASLSNHDTDDLSEGTGNLYFSTARARSSISGGTGITYSSSTGQVELTASGVTAGSYGSASAVPVVTVDAYGRITGVTTTAVAGVSSVSYDSNSEVLTINTSDGGTPSVDLSIGGSLNGPLDEITVKYLASAPSTPIQGQFYFDSLNQKMKVYTGSAWVDAVPQGASSGGGETTDAVATMEKFTYTISSTTNAVSGSDDNSNTLSYIVDGSQNVEVYVNGIKQVEGATNDYVATTGTSVAFTYNLPSGSVVDVQVYELLTQDAFYLKAETYTQSEVNTQISTAVSSYLPLSGGTLTGDLTTTGLTVDTDTLHVDNVNNRVGIGTTSPSDSLTIDLVASNTGITLSDSGNDLFPQIKYDSNRPNPGQSLGKFSSYWNGTEVARIEFAAGNDNINKDDGAILFNTRVSGGSLTTKVKIDTNGNVGIGRSPSTYSSPGVALEIGDGHGILGYGDNFHLSNNAYYNSGWLRNFTGAATNLVSANGQWTFRNSGSDSAGTGISWTDQLVIQSNGNVGIGTSNPGKKLDVNGEARITTGLTITPATSNVYATDSTLSSYATGNGVYLNGHANGWLRLNGSGANRASVDVWGENYAAPFGDSITFRTGNTANRMMIAASGNVGIGTTSPSDNLHIASSSTWSGLKIENSISNGAGSTITLNSTGDLNRTAYIRMDARTGEDALKLETNASNLQLFANNAARVYVNSVGRVGIGVSNPSYPVTVGHSNPNNGIVQQLRNTASNGNGAFLHFDINNVGDYSIGMPNNDNSFVIGKDLGNTGDQIVRIEADGSIERKFSNTYPSRELTFNWERSVSTSFVDIVTVNTGSAHLGYFYEIICTGGDWSNHSSARSYHKGFMNGYSGYGGMTQIENSGPYGANIIVNGVFIDGAGNTKLQIRLDSGSVGLEIVVRLVGRISNHTIHR